MANGHLHTNGNPNRQGGIAVHIPSLISKLSVIPTLNKPILLGNCF